MDESRGSITVLSSEGQIGFCADVHADLNSMIEMLETRPDVERWFCAGDVTDRYKALHYNEPALRALHRLEIPSVMGNHDYRVRERDARKLGEEARAQLAAMPLCLRIQFGELRIRVYHATPTSREHFLYERDGEAAFRKHFDGIDADLFELGHTHAPFDRVFGGKRFVNPGALGVDEVRPSFYVLDASGEAKVVYLDES